MKQKKELLKSIESITANDDAWKTNVEFLIENDDWLDDSLLIASKILARLKDLNWKQVDLAAAMHVSAQQVNKWVKGTENFQLSTLKKLERALGIPLIRVVDNTNDVAGEAISLLVSKSQETFVLDAFENLITKDSINYSPIRSKKPFFETNSFMVVADELYSEVA